MPRTSIPPRRNDVAAAEITALAAGAGPPANRIAALRKLCGLVLLVVLLVSAMMLSLEPRFSAQSPSARRPSKGSREAGAQLILEERDGLENRPAPSRGYSAPKVRSTNVVSIRPSWNALWLRIS